MVDISSNEPVVVPPQGNLFARTLNRFAHYRPCTVGAFDAPVRIEYTIGDSDFLPGSQIVVSACMAGAKHSHARWTLPIQSLPATTASELHSLLSNADSQPPRQVLDSMIRLLGPANASLWESHSQDTSAFLGGLERGLMPVLPSIIEYCADPGCCVKRFITRVTLENEDVALRVTLDPAKHLLGLKVGDTTSSAFGCERYVFTTTTHERDIPSDASGDGYAHLLLVAEDCVETLRSRGLNEFRALMASVAKKNAASSTDISSKSQARFAMTRDFSHGTSLRFSVDRDTIKLTTILPAFRVTQDTASRPFTNQWLITSSNPEGRDAVLDSLDQLLPELATLSGERSIHGVADEFNRIADRQSFRCPPVSAVLGSKLTEQLLAIPGIHVRNVERTHRQSTEHIARVIQGINCVEISTTSFDTPRNARHTLHTVELRVLPPSLTSGQEYSELNSNQLPTTAPALEVLTWNWLNNSMYAFFTPATVAAAGGFDCVVKNIAQALSCQCDSEAAWLQRAAFLRMLRNLERLDQKNLLIQEGDAHFPAIDDLESHKLIDQVASEVINRFCVRTKEPRSSSYVTTRGHRKLLIALGELEHDYALELELAQSILKTATVIPRKFKPDGSAVLARTSQESFKLDVPLGDRDLDGAGATIVGTITDLFADLVSPPDNQGTRRATFKNSALRRHLGEIATRM